VLVHDTGYVKSLLHFPGFAVDPYRKRSKAELTNGKALESACQDSSLKSIFVKEKNRRLSTFGFGTD
jgi:hypothetical protein